MLNKEIIEQISQSTLQEGLATMAALFRDQIVFSTSLGQEDQVITDAICRHEIPVKIFTIDTGRMFPETYELFDKTVARYKKPIHIYFPDAKDVEEYVLQKGMNGFYESPENRKLCCDVRKVKPLNRALEGAKVWVTGLRAEQSINRKQMHMIEWDDQRSLYKFNPLINWSYNDVLQYIKNNFVPTSSLHDKGFISIGCAPCTRAIEAGEDPRAGRWWWETSQKECGLHSTLVPLEEIKN
jgi:phosphoadenosine phosphosulfate reductase